MRMGQTTRRIVIAIVLAAAATGSVLPGARTLAADVSRGQLLYENHCTICHTSIVHVRERRKAASRAEIQAWVLKWQSHLGLGWEGEEIEDVAEYLNQRFYRLDEDS